MPTKSKKLIDIIGEMNPAYKFNMTGEDKSRDMVIDKLNQLSHLIFEVDNKCPDLEFVDTILEDLIQSPHKRITRIEIEKCNRLWKQYQ